MIGCHAFAQGASASISSYQQLIAELQGQPDTLGTSTTLAEAYASLGSALQEEEQHADAIAAYTQALQFVREANGLLALEQFPLLEARLASHQAMAAWSEIDADRRLAWLIAHKNPAADIGLRYQTLRELGLWRLKAADEELLEDAMDGAKEAVLLYQRELADAEILAAYQQSPLSLANLYLDLAALEFLQARKKIELPLGAYMNGGQRTVTETYCETIQTADGRTRQVCRNLQVPNIDYYLSLTDRKYAAAWDHLQPMQDAVLKAWATLLPEVQTSNRDAALKLLAEVHSLTNAYNSFVAKYGKKETGTRITAPTGSRIDR